MNYIKLLAALLAKVVLSASSSSHQRTGECSLSFDYLLWMKTDIVCNDKPLENFASLVQYQRLVSHGSGYSLQNLLKDTLDYNRVESFKFIYSRAQYSPDVDAFDLFQIAYFNNNMEICDFLMNLGIQSGTSFREPLTLQYCEGPALFLQGQSRSMY